ncbi:MAG: methylamine---glutamate N-methyltransferase subunit [Actinomycetota bacterium]|nr:methylamine---glutamate N-methyltransferase subunit [Actinomycetota bacterium]
MAQLTVPSDLGFSPVVDCSELTTREINLAVRELIEKAGATEVVIRNPAARHNLGVAIKAEAELRFEGPVGWYAAGMNCGLSVTVRGNCGWGVAECMMSGRVAVYGHAGSSTAASIRGGSVYVDGDAGARAGIAMKGGLLVVRGSVGYMTGFMMQRGTIVVGGDAADGLGDSMYEGTIYIAGEIESLGADAVEKDLNDDDVAALCAALTPWDTGLEPKQFRKIESGRKLWNFSAHEPEMWKVAL